MASTPELATVGASARMRDLFTPEHDMYRESVRRFIKQEIEPHYREWEKLPQGMPKEVWRKSGEAGLVGVCIPEEYGGPGGDILYNAILSEELGSSIAGASIGSSWGESDVLTAIVLKFGTEQQKRELFPRILSGEVNQALGLTEPGAGSDVANISTRARREGDEFVINGQKTFISNSLNAGIVYIIAKTERDVEGSRHNMTMFAVDPATPGFDRRRLDTLGCKAQAITEIFLSNVRVPKSAMLGEEGQALRQNLTFVLSSDRALIALRTFAVAKLAFDLTLQYVKDRKAFGRRVLDFQNTQFKLADMKAIIEVGEGFRETLLRQMVIGHINDMTSAVAKLWYTENTLKIVADCLQLFGGYGWMTEVPISSLFTFARLQTLHSGTSEIQRKAIARHL
jgi:acyl-CoA dehydrogenase